MPRHGYDDAIFVFGTHLKLHADFLQSPQIDHEYQQKNYRRSAALIFASELITLCRINVIIVTNKTL